MSDNRPDPEKLLKRVQIEEEKKGRGKLKIYLGAAPGVGKTHEMLHDALEERVNKRDVIIGVVESHGRKDIEKMAKFFDSLPKKEIPYQGRELLEFDLDAALKRKPSLILMDEMAHTNVEGLRHKKRWQDIKELLDRGIDVYTTLNVQHIESLNDAVSQIVHAPIKETVPDSMIEMADTLELVDLPAEELIKRLHEGKVYVPAQAELAIEHFFKEGNLIALRELALRTVADRVGSDVILYRQDKGIKHIWPTKEKILVCVGPGPEAKKLIRAARRMAISLQIDWIAVFVETPKIQTSEMQRNYAIQNLQFAESLGGMTRVLTGFNLVKEIMTFAREHNVTQIMIWKNIRSRLRNIFFRDLADEIVRNSAEIDVYIMTGENKNISFPRKSLFSSLIKGSLQNYIFGIFIVTLITAINFMLSYFLSEINLIMIYLPGCNNRCFIWRNRSRIFSVIIECDGICFFLYFTLSIWNI